MYAFQKLKKPIRIFYSKTSAINKTNHLDDVFNLYEAMYFDGTPIGFATKGIIEEQDNNDWSAVLVYQTEFVTTDELNTLQTYLDNGGTVILDATSLKKNEYGVNHTISLNTSNGTIIAAASIASFKDKAFSLLSDNNELPALKLEETNPLNIKGCFSRTISKQNGTEVMTIVNMGKSDTEVQLSYRNGKTISSITNLLTGQNVPATFTMTRDAVLLLEVKQSTLSVEEVIDDVFNYYPNPTTGFVNFKANKIIENISIHNVLGQEVLNLKTQEKILKIDFKEFSKGVYLVKMMMEGETKVVSVIKK